MPFAFCFSDGLALSVDDVTTRDKVGGACVCVCVVVGLGGVKHRRCRVIVQEKPTSRLFRPVALRDGESGREVDPRAKNRPEWPFARRTKKSPRPKQSHKLQELWAKLHSHTETCWQKDSPIQLKCLTRASLSARMLRFQRLFQSLRLYFCNHLLVLFRLN